MCPAFFSSSVLLNISFAVSYGFRYEIFSLQLHPTTTVLSCRYFGNSRFDASTNRFRTSETGILHIAQPAFTQNIMYVQMKHK